MLVHKSNRMERINKKAMLYTYLTAMIILLLILALANVTRAQTTVAIGAKAGYSGSEFSGEDVGSLDVRQTLAAGAFINISPARFLSFQPELLFHRKGAVNHRDAFNIREEYELEYLETPLLVKVRVPIGKVFYPNVFGGPYFAFKTNSSYRAVQTNTEITYSRELDVKNTDYGAVVGGGVDIELKPIFLSIDVRYGIGATEIENSDEPLDLKNRDLTVMGGIGILFGNK